MVGGVGPLGADRHILTRVGPHSVPSPRYFPLRTSCLSRKGASDFQQLLDTDIKGALILRGL